MVNLMGDIILVFIAAGLGVLIGYNLRNESAQRKENMKFEEVDRKVREELQVAKNLNKSLLDDVNFLREKIKRLKILHQR